MNRNATILTTVALVASLAAGTVFATGAARLPDEVQSASIQVPEGVETQAAFADYAKITRQQAEAAALAVRSGRVVKAELDDEDGYLVWQIDVQHAKGTTEIAVDAGDGKVLAAETDDDEDEDEREHEDREDEQRG